ncbi:Hypothetical predicted protein, partial [Paramuricea clavata]
KFRDLIVDILEESWKDEVRNKLAEVFKNNEEDFARILFFLDEEDKAYKDDSDRPYAPQWRSLKAKVKMDKAFREFAKRLSDETRIPKKDERFRKHLIIVYEQILSHCDDTVEIEKCQKPDPNQFDAISKSAFSGLARAWSIIPTDSKVSLMNSIREIVSKSGMTQVENVLAVADHEMGGTTAMVDQPAFHIRYDVRVNIKLWWKSKISGERCIKNVLDLTVTIAGMAGGAAGVYIGSAIAGPLGGLVGGFAGGWLSAAGMRYVSDWMTQNLFGLPKQKALENAYRYLGAETTASNAEVNTAFRKLALKHHPDRGGNEENFLTLQLNMAVIKEARENS